MTKYWWIALLIAGFGGKAFADCVPSPDTPASVIEYFQKFNKPLPEQFCAKEEAVPQISEKPSREPSQAYEDGPETRPFEWRDRYSQLTPRYAPHPESDEIDVANPTAQESPHAIVPDAPQATAPTTEVPTPQAGEPSAEVPTPQATAPTADCGSACASKPSAECGSAYASKSSAECGSA